MFIQLRTDWFKFWIYFRFHKIFKVWRGKRPSSDSPGVFIKYLNSQVHPGSNGSEFMGLELRNFIKTSSSDDSHTHKKLRSIIPVARFPHFYNLKYL